MHDHANDAKTVSNSLKIIIMFGEPAKSESADLPISKYIWKCILTAFEAQVADLFVKREKLQLHLTPEQKHESRREKDLTPIFKFDRLTSWKHSWLLHIQSINPENVWLPNQVQIVWTQLDSRWVVLCLGHYIIEQLYKSLVSPVLPEVDVGCNALKKVNINFYSVTKAFVVPKKFIGVKLIRIGRDWNCSRRFRGYQAYRNSDKNSDGTGNLVNFLTLHKLG